MHASDLADVLEEDGGDTQPEDGDLHTRGEEMASPSAARGGGNGSGGGREGSTRVPRRRVSEREAGRRSAAEASGQEAPAIGTADGCVVTNSTPTVPLACASGSRRSEAGSASRCFLVVYSYSTKFEQLFTNLRVSFKQNYF